MRRGVAECLSGPIPPGWLCRDCGHAYREHYAAVGCAHQMEEIGGPGLCECRCFALPVVYLESQGMGGIVTGITGARKS